MLVPLLITGSILGGLALVARRDAMVRKDEELPPPVGPGTSSAPTSMSPYGGLQQVERPASSSTPTSTSTAPVMLPAPAPVPTAQEIAAFQSGELTMRAAMLLAEGQSASPASLLDLAGQIARVAPADAMVQALTTLAQANATGAVVSGRPPYMRVGQSFEDPRVTAQILAARRMQQQHAAMMQQLGLGPSAPSYFRPHSVVPPAQPSGQPSGVSRQTSAQSFAPGEPAPGTSPAEQAPPSRRRKLPEMQCIEPAGCALYRTPSNLYPMASTTIPHGATVIVVTQDGSWASVQHRGIRGWMPLAALGNLQPASMQDASNNL